MFVFVISQIQFLISTLLSTRDVEESGLVTLKLITYLDHCQSLTISPADTSEMNVGGEALLGHYTSIANTGT